MEQRLETVNLVEFWGLPCLIPLLQYVNRLGFEICSVNRMNNRTRKLGYVNLNWPRCSARVTESLALTDGSFCQKQNTLYFRLCKNCEFMMCSLIVDHQFNRMHPWCSWECIFQEGAVLAKSVTPFGIGISCCYQYFWVK